MLNMLLTDLSIILALLLCLFLWWRRSAPNRSRWLLVVSVLIAAIACWSVLDHRWQAAFALLPVLWVLAGLALGRKWPRQGIPWISGSLLAVLAAIAVLCLHFFPTTKLPAPSGEYAVGVLDFELQDRSRPGVMAAGPNEPRRLLVRVWYPASNTNGMQPRPYFSDQEVDTTATAIGRFLNAPFAFKYLKHVKTNSFEGAPLAQGLADLPVIIYSHGYTSFAGQNTALMEELASHGYVVYSIQHTFDSAPTVFPNGDVLDSDPKLMEEMMANVEPSEAMKRGFVGATYSERRAGQIDAHNEAMEANQRIAARSARIWTEDRIFVHDQLQAGAVPEEVRNIVRAGDFEHTGQIGMSFGGSTTGEVCMLDKRCAAGVNLDGADYHFTPFGQNEPVPFLMFYSDYQKIAEMLSEDPGVKGSGFNDFSYERPETAGLRGDVVRLKVNEVSHLGVSDFTLFVRTPLRNPLFGSIDSQDMIRIQNDFVLGFFDTYLRHKQAGYPQEQFAKHRAWVQQEDLGPLRQDWLESHPEDETVRVIFETSEGEIEVALYPKRAPVTVANFLAYVDAGHYSGSSFYRVTRQGTNTTIGVVQGGLAAESMTKLSVEEIGQVAPIFPPIEHETTDRTGIPNEPGTLSMARLAPGTASSEFFFNVDDNPALDTGNTSRNPDGKGYATFGRVLRGLPLLRRIQAMPSDAPVAVEFMRGQMLEKPIEIRRVYRVDAR
jgi:predicted dienelactone hydrolase/cyclophilin family peptidyl-prolyl cis-trans isomerase